MIRNRPRGDADNFGGSFRPVLPPKWVPDACVDKCKSCDQEFTSFRRKVYLEKITTDSFFSITADIVVKFSVVAAVHKREELKNMDLHKLKKSATNVVQF